MSLQKIMAEQTVNEGEIKALIAKGADNLTDVEMNLIDEKRARIKALDIEVARYKKIEEAEKEILQRAAPDASARPSDHTIVVPGSTDIGAAKAVDIPIQFKNSTPRNFMSAGMSRSEAQQAAFKWGQFLLGSILGNPKANEWCQKNGIPVTKAQSENINQFGGFLVPIDLENFIIQLRENFGMARKLFHRVAMKSDTANIPRRSGAPNYYWLTDGQSITASQKTFDQVTVTANKLASLILYSSEIAEDAVIDLGDDLAKEIAYIFSYAEDTAAFVGDGTSGYGGFVGMCPQLQKAQGNPTGAASASTAGLAIGQAGSGAAWSSFALKDFNLCQGSLPDFAWTRGEPGWLVSRQFYFTVMVELLAAAGGNRIDTIETGPDMRQPMFLGSPVYFSQVMPRTGGTANQVVALYGDYSLAAEFGDRRGTTIALSDQYAFNSDQIAIRGITRLGINVHDVGGSNAASTAENPAYTAGSVVAGPVVGLQSAST